MRRARQLVQLARESHARRPRTKAVLLVLAVWSDDLGLVATSNSRVTPAASKLSIGERQSRLGTRQEVKNDQY